jgi:hypothetical protein
LVQFGIGGWILCMAAYKLVSVSTGECAATRTGQLYHNNCLFQLNVLSIEFASMTLFITCILTELFLYCYYGNEVAVEVSVLSQ